MIKEEIIRHYRVICDQCGCFAVFGVTRKDALLLASEEGFQHIERIRGGLLLRTDLCSHCAYPHGQ